MATIKCHYCNLLLPQNTLTSHMRSNHAPPSATDLSNLYKNLIPKVPLAISPEMPNRVSNTPPRTAAQTAASVQGEESTLYSDWSKRNAARQSDYVTVDDVVCSRVIRTNQPQKTVVALEKAVRYDVQDMVRVFDGLSNGVREACYEYIRTTHVFPALTTFVFLHLSLCSPDDDRLWHFKMNMRRYQVRGEEWCILHYANIRDFLYCLYLRSPVDRHICNQSLICNGKLHILDIQHLGAQVASYLMDRHRAQSFHEAIEKSKDSKGVKQSMVDLLQALLDLRPHEFDEWYRPCFLGAVIHLTRKGLVYPACLEINGIGDRARTKVAGGFGVIYQGSLLGRTVALKKLKDREQGYDKLIKDFAHEAVLWRNVNHTNCLPFYGILKGKDGDLCLVSPWMERGDLASYLLENHGVDRLPLVYDIASGLEYLHKMQPTIVHGDLKCLNIFVTNTHRACIADFGLSNVRDFSIKANSSMTVGGTQGFIAPEMYSAAARNEIRTLDLRRCDMFAFGVVIYEIYGGEKSKLNECNINAGNRPPRLPQHLCEERGLDDDIWHLIECLWQHNPNARFVAESARGFIGEKLQARGGIRSPMLDQDPEWNLDFLRRVSVATSPFELRVVGT